MSHMHEWYHTWMRYVTRIWGSHVTHKRVVSHVESCDAYKWCMNESCDTYNWVCGHVPCGNMRLMLLLNESGHTRRVMSCIWMGRVVTSDWCDSWVSHITLEQSCHAWMSYVGFIHLGPWMSHVTRQESSRIWKRKRHVDFIHLGP